MFHHAIAPLRTPCFYPRGPSCVWDGSQHLVKWASPALGHGRADTTRGTSWSFTLWSGTPLGSPCRDASRHGSSWGHCWPNSNGLPASKRPNDWADPAHTHGPHGPATASHPWIRVWWDAARDASYIVSFTAPAPLDDAATAHVLHAAPGPDATAAETRHPTQ